MEIGEFIEKAWPVISAAPSTFISCAILFFVLGFTFARLLYKSIANTAKERLEAARDDLARLEKGKREETETVEKLRKELAELKEEVDTKPDVYFGSDPPDDNIGKKDGDFYVQLAKGSKEDKLSPMSDDFFIVRPNYELESALKEAKKKNKLVFAVIYDETHPKKSKLNFSLGYFMEYHTTKKLVDEYFVPVILKASNDEAQKLVPEEDPLENCLLVVLKPDGSIVRREGVYANPDEGLKRVRAIIRQWEHAP